MRYVSAQQRADAADMGAAAMGLDEPPTAPVPVQSPVDSAEFSALAGHDDMVGYQRTPVFDAIVTELDGDPRGMEVQSWKEISYAGGRRGLCDGEGDSGEREKPRPGGRRRRKESRADPAVQHDAGVARGDGGERGAG